MLSQVAGSPFDRPSTYPDQVLDSLVPTDNAELHGSWSSPARLECH